MVELSDGAVVSEGSSADEVGAIGNELDGPWAKDHEGLPTMQPRNISLLTGSSFITVDSYHIQTAMAGPKNTDGGESAVIRPISLFENCYRLSMILFRVGLGRITLAAVVSSGR